MTNDEMEDAMDQVMSQRDEYHDCADMLAAAIAEITGVDIGEHSSANDPWSNALKVAIEFSPPGEQDWVPLSECEFECKYAIDEGHWVSQPVEVAAGWVHTDGPASVRVRRRQ